MLFLLLVPPVFLQDRLRFLPFDAFNSDMEHISVEDASVELELQELLDLDLGPLLVR